MRSLAIVCMAATLAATLVAAQTSPCQPACASGQGCLLVSVVAGAAPGGGNAGVYQCSATQCGATGFCPATQFCNYGLNAANPSAATCVANAQALPAISTSLSGSASGGSGGMSLTAGSFPGMPSFGTGGFGSTCTANTDCTAQGFTCVNGFCLPGLNADCPTACDSGFSCQYGVCVPRLDAPCDPVCATGLQCFFGQCVPAGPSCSPACGTGYICAGPTLGCVATASATCSPTCTNGFQCVAGMCVPPAPSCAGTCPTGQYCGPDPAAYTGVNPFTASGSASATLTWKCIAPPGSAASATCSPTCNASTQICALGTCITKPAFPVGTASGAVAQAVLDALLCGSLNVGSLPLPTGAPMSGNTASFAGNIFAQIEASASIQWPSLTFTGSGSATGASAQSALTVGASAQVAAAAFMASLPNVGVVVNAAAAMAIAAATIAVNATVTWSFAAAAAGSSAAAGVVSLAQLDLSGNIIVTGSGRFQFPLDPSKVTVARGAGAVQFSGGATLSGNAATAAVQVNGGATGSAEVFVGATAFTTAGNILGSSGSVQVNGAFAFAGASIQPSVHVNSGGAWTINGTAVQTGEVSINAGGSVAIRSNGKSVRMGVIKSCEAGATITYYASGTFSAGTASSGTITAYAAGTSTTSFDCGVRIIDESGAVADLTVQKRPNTNSWLPGGGFIFAGSSGSANFGAQTLTYTGAQANGATTHAPSSTLAIAVALVIAVAGRYLM